MDSICDLCNIATASDRRYGLALCRTCHDSAADGILEARGCTVRTERTHIDAGRTNNEVFRYQTVVTLPRPAPFEATFRKETTLTLIRRYLPGPPEPTAGDPFFDDRVHVDAGRSIVPLIRVPSVQDALMEICPHGSLVIEGVELRGEMSFPHDPGEVDARLPVVVVALAVLELTQPGRAEL